MFRGDSCFSAKPPANCSTIISARIQRIRALYPFFSPNPMTGRNANDTASCARKPDYDGRVWYITDKLISLSVISITFLLYLTLFDWCDAQKMCHDINASKFFIVELFFFFFHLSWLPVYLKSERLRANKLSSAKVWNL